MDSQDLSSDSHFVTVTLDGQSLRRQLINIPVDTARFTIPVAAIQPVDVATADVVLQQEAK
jgi:hypothetical protein